MKSEYILSALLSLLVIYLLYLIFSPFFIPIFWAVAFVILFYPYYRWLLLKITDKSWLASLIACASIAFFLMIPMAIIGAAVTGDFLKLYQLAENYIRNLSIRTNPPDYIAPYLRKYLGQHVDISEIDLKNIVANSVKSIASYVGEGLTGFIKGIVWFLFDLLLSFFAMFFLFKDGDKIIDILKDILPVSENDKEEILQKTRDVISASIYGGVAVGAVQGLLGGLMFWLLGLFAPMLWGFGMFIFSFLPVGTALVWGPVAIYLFIKGNFGQALALSAWCLILIGFVDYMLRPMIVSGKTDIHPLLLFFSILGGVTVFGFIGIIAGPLIVSIGLATIDIYRHYLKSKEP